MRTGIGYDVHRLVSGRKLIIGGVNIDFEKGLLGHSDADVLLHAIGDALLGACGLGDLGEHFSDKDPKFKDMNSMDMLGDIVSLIGEKGYVPHNIDAVVIAQAPKLSPYKETMRSNIAQVLGLDLMYVNVKATTEEGMGFTGKGEGMAAWASVLIRLKDE